MSVFKQGAKFTLLPGAKSLTEAKPLGALKYLENRTVTVLDEGVDEDGDVFVRDSEGWDWYVSPEYLEAV